MCIFRLATLRQLVVVGVLSLCMGTAQDLDRRALVVGGELPLYPSVAVAARLEGTVIVSISVSKGIVQKAETRPEANALLASAAKRNALSWRFAPETTGTLAVRFIFELAKTEVLVPENPEIQMRLPESVRIVAKPVKPLTVGESSIQKGVREEP